MSDHDPKHGADSVPPILWALFGAFVVALFVLALGLLHTPA
jgi:hypothetical protein